MEREEFLKKLGIGTMAVCMGCSLVACSSKSNDPGPKPGSGPVFTLDLNTNLTNIGDSKTSSGIIVVRIADGNAAASFTAVQVACTHEGTAINYNQSLGLFICPLHGSEFSKTGTVIQGPALTPLQKFNVMVSGTTLTVVA